MTFEKIENRENGYLLLESLMTLMILMSVLLIMCPLVINWLAIHNEAKDLVEESRLLYESSMHLNSSLALRNKAEEYTVGSNKKMIQIKETGTGVFIYESSFE